MENNLFYNRKQVELSNDNLLLLPIDDVPEVIMNNIEYIASDDLDFFENKGYDNLNMTAEKFENFENNTDIELEKTGIFETDESIKMSIVDQIEIFKDRIINKKKKTNKKKITKMKKLF